MLICFDKAERHLPDRCLRQFGLRQPIPLDVQQWERKSRGVDGGVDLSGKMETELSEWSERHLRVVDCDEEVEETEYLHWYLKITRKLVGRPIPISSEFQRMVNIYILRYFYSAIFGINKNVYLNVMDLGPMHAHTCPRGCLVGFSFKSYMDKDIKLTVD